MARRAAIAALVPLLAACGGPPASRPPDDAGEAGAPRGGEDEPAEVDAPAEEAPAARFLPVERDVVWWYRARFTRSGRARDVVLFAAEDERFGRYLETLRRTRGGAVSLRLWRTEEGVWLQPGRSIGGPAYRAWTPAERWDRDLGRRRGWERVTTPSGEHRALRVAYGNPLERLVRHWLAPGTGLVRLDVYQLGERVLTLELERVVPRGRPDSGYDVATPGAAWESIQRALTRLDLSSLESLLAPELEARMRRTGWDAVADLEPPPGLRRGPTDARVHRTRAQVGQLLALDVTPAGPWRTEGERATAPAELTVPGEDGDRTSEARIVLRRVSSGAWRWHDLELDEGGEDGF